MDSNSIKVLAENSEIISGVINIITALIYAGATCFAAIVAVRSIKSWREEFIGKRKIELTTNTIFLLYKVKSAINSIRSNWFMQGEGTTREVTEAETPIMKKFRDEAYSRIERFEKRQDLFDELLSEKFKFMAEFGKETEEHFDKIKHIVNTILVYVSHYPDAKMEHYDLRKEKQGLKQFGSDTAEVDRKLLAIEKQIQEYKSFLNYQGKGDTIEKDIDEIISKIENIYKK